MGSTKVRRLLPRWNEVDSLSHLFLIYLTRLDSTFALGLRLSRQRDFITLGIIKENLDLQLPMAPN